MEKKSNGNILRAILIGSRYPALTNINEQARYLTINFVFMIAIIPLAALGYTMIGLNSFRAFIDFGFAAMLFFCLFLIRTKVPFQAIAYVMVSLYGLYCVYLLYTGALTLWASVWTFSFPVIAVFLCKMTVGVIQSCAVLAAAAFLLFGNLTRRAVIREIEIRYIAVYILILALAIIYERISIRKDEKEANLRNELAQQRDVIKTMQDNIPQGIFLMNSDLVILPGYSKPLISILSYYDSDLTGKNFLDMLSASLDAQQLKTMKGYFSMVFSKSKSAKILESVNPISEFEYRVDNRLKTLTTRFSLIEKEGAEPAVLAIVEDITREKEFERELLAQKEAQQLEMKNMFDVIQIDPLVFNDFIEDTESNFNYINSILKDRSLTEKQVLTKFFQNVHAVKSNALILGLETLSKKLHELEDEIKAVSGYKKIVVDDVLGLALKLEEIMKEKDEYIKVTRKIEAFKTSNQMDSVLIHSLTKAVEKTASETQKKVELKAGQVDLGILESKLRKPIKDILFQCIRNSIYHGIEPVDERIQKNKRPTSLLVFSIRKTDGSAEVIFSDDGRGLDWEKIKTKYLASHPGLKEVNRKILLSSIFSPEFSTADETSTLAGRGVGLSLVRDIVKENNGTIKVDSSEAGLTLKFTFPLAS